MKKGTLPKTIKCIWHLQSWRVVFPFQKKKAVKERSPEEGDVQQKSWPQSHPAWAALNLRREERASSCEQGDAAAKNFQPLTQFEERIPPEAAQLQDRAGKAHRLLCHKHSASSAWAGRLAKKLFAIVLIRQSLKVQLAGIVIWKMSEIVFPIKFPDFLGGYSRYYNHYLTSLRGAYSSV